MLKIASIMADLNSIRHPFARHTPLNNYESRKLCMFAVMKALFIPRVEVKILPEVEGKDIRRMLVSKRKTTAPIVLPWFR